MPGQTKLAGIAIATQLVLILLVATHLFLAYAMFDLAPAFEDIGSRDADAILTFDATTTVQSAATLGAGLIFVIWFFSAYRNMSVWHQQRRNPLWTIFVWLVPFINLVRPMRMMMELAQRSGREDRPGGTGGVLVMAWWLLWVVSVFLQGVMVYDQDPAYLSRISLLGGGVSMILNAISIVFAIVLVQKITDHQDSRFQPTAAQRELINREAEIANFKGLSRPIA